MVSLKPFYLVCCLVLMGASTLCAMDGDQFEFQAVNLGKDEKSATKKLNVLLKDGWEIHGVVGNNLTAFRRKLNPKTEDVKPEPKNETPKVEAPKVEPPKKIEPTKEEPKTVKPVVKPEPKPEAPKVVEKPTTPAKNPDEAPEVPVMQPIIDKIAATVSPNPKSAPSPNLEDTTSPPAMMPEAKTVERPATKPMDQVASASTPSTERSVLKPTNPEELPKVLPRVPAAGELEAVQGTWSLLVYVLNGRQVRDNDVRCTWTVDGERWTSRWVNEAGVAQVASGVIKYVDGKNGVKSVDLIHTDGLYKGRTTYSIYQVEDGVLKYCYTGNPELRPGVFSTADGDGLGLVVWQKVK